MEEVEIISEKELKKTIENFSIEELVDYKKKVRRLHRVFRDSY